MEVGTLSVEGVLRMLRLRALHLLQEELRLAANVGLIITVSVGTLDVWETGL